MRAGSIPALSTMTLMQFIAAHKQPPPSMGLGNKYLEEFRKQVEHPMYENQGWARDVLKYYENPNAYMDLVMYLHLPRVEFTVL